MTGIPFALYNAFSKSGFGGSQAGIIPQAISIDVDARKRIAREIGVAATSFVSQSNSNQVDVQFFSTVTELLMCGHGTVCLMTRLVDPGILKLNGTETSQVKLQLAATIANVEISKRDDQRTLVMLDVLPPRFRSDDLELKWLPEIPGDDANDFRKDLPMETAVGGVATKVFDRQLYLPTQSS